MCAPQPHQCARARPPRPKPSWIVRKCPPGARAEPLQPPRPRPGARPSMPRSTAPQKRPRPGGAASRVHGFRRALSPGTRRAPAPCPRAPDPRRGAPARPRSTTCTCPPPTADAGAAAWGVPAALRGPPRARRRRAPVHEWAAAPHRAPALGAVACAPSAESACDGGWWRRRRHAPALARPASPAPPAPPAPLA
eukprot:scaffold110646_cov56-Phaeocystis_antarctica.AAC.2